MAVAIADIVILAITFTFHLVVILPAIFIFTLADKTAAGSAETPLSSTDILNGDKPSKDKHLKLDTDPPKRPFCPEDRTEHDDAEHWSHNACPHTQDKSDTTDYLKSRNDVGKPRKKSDRTKETSHPLNAGWSKKFIPSSIQEYNAGNDTEHKHSTPRMSTFARTTTHAFHTELILNYC